MLDPKCQETSVIPRYSKTETATLFKKENFGATFFWIEVTFRLPSLLRWGKIKILHPYMKTSTKYVHRCVISTKVNQGKQRQTKVNKGKQRKTKENKDAQSRGLLKSMK